MLDLDAQVWLDASKCGEEMIEDLLRRHPIYSSTCRHFQPTGLIPVIALGKVPGAHQDDVAFIGQFHTQHAIHNTTLARQSSSGSALGLGLGDDFVALLVEAEGAVSLRK